MYVHCTSMSVNLNCTYNVRTLYVQCPLGGKEYECLLDIGIGLQRAGRFMVNHHNQQAEFKEEKTVPYIGQQISGLSRCYRVLAGRAAVTVRLLWVNTERKELSSDDTDIVPIWTRLVSAEENPTWNEMSEFSLATKAYWGGWQCLVMGDGVIYRKWESYDGVQVHTQVLVPSGQWKEILQQAHGEKWTAHLGVKGTVVNGEMLITFDKPDNWSSTKGAEEDEPREHDVETSGDSESEDNRPDVKPEAKIHSRNGKEQENSQRTSGRRERGPPRRDGCT